MKQRRAKISHEMFWLNVAKDVFKLNTPSALLYSAYVSPRFITRDTPGVEYRYKPSQRQVHAVVHITRSQWYGEIVGELWGHWDTILTACADTNARVAHRPPTEPTRHSQSKIGDGIYTTTSSLDIERIADIENEDELDDIDMLPVQ